MEYSIETGPGITEIALRGRMTFSDHEKFRHVMAAFQGPEGHHMVFDLTGLEFVDSSGLGMLIIARDTAQNKQLEFTLRGARDNVRRLMEIAKFNRMFVMQD
jgi:anti-anti-sigma factor